ncbi:MAG: DUF368 domain-containing protein [Eubacteriales bacterium]|nr:DUF368 domain-containing protein [Eubacteriales bacterium]
MAAVQPKNFILRLVQGAIIGAGAILPGVSGGVLAVIFGIYRPMMEVLTHPMSALRRYWRILLPIGIGWVLGFFGGSGVILLLFHHSETLATCLFVGLILGTVPDLWREAGERGRSKGAYFAAAASFSVLLSLLLGVQFGAFGQMKANFFGFLFCGVLWGLSLIVPGMTSSSILMAVGLLTPMIEGITTLDLSVLVPWLLGMLSTILLLARLISWLFRTHHMLASHAVVGIVLASTLVIVPVQYATVGEALLCLVCAVIGAVLAHFSGKLQTKDA